MFYDWRNRLVATKSGVLMGNLSGEASDGVRRPIIYRVMDNLGDVTAAYVFSGSGVSVSAIAAYNSDATPSPTSSTADLLRSFSTESYDSWAGVWAVRYGVNQTSGAIGSTRNSGRLLLRCRRQPARRDRPAGRNDQLRV